MSRYRQLACACALGFCSLVVACGSDSANDGSSAAGSSSAGKNASGEGNGDSGADGIGDAGEGGASGHAGNAGAGPTKTGKGIVKLTLRAQ